MALRIQRVQSSPFKTVFLPRSPWTKPGLASKMHNNLISLSDVVLLDKVLVETRKDYFSIAWDTLLPVEFTNTPSILILLSTELLTIRTELQTINLPNLSELCQSGGSQ